MPITRINNDQIENEGIIREDINVSTPGDAVITRLITGEHMLISSTGADEGTGDVTIDVDMSYLSAGVITPLDESMFSAVGLNITVPTLEVAIYDNPDFHGDLHKFTVAGTVLTAVNEAANYIYIDYNGGNPVYAITMNPLAISWSDKIPVNTTMVWNNFVHFSHWNNPSGGLANKLEKRLTRTERFAVASGLTLSWETPVMSVSEGLVWRGAREFNLEPVYSDQRTTSRWFFFRKVAGDWVGTTGAAAFNNTQYQDPNDLVALDPGKFTINWMFRGVEDHEHVYYILGSEQYDSLQAAVAITSIPELPSHLIYHCVVVGRVIAQEGNPEPALVENKQDESFSGTIINDHGKLGGLQGGNSGERYHLTLPEHNFLTHIAAEKVGRDDVDIDTVGHAVARKIVAGDGILLESTGADPGTGDVKIINSHHDAGVVTYIDASTFTVSGLDITIPTLDVAFFDSPIFEGPVKVMSVPGTTLTCPNNAVSYLCADYNGGNPIFFITTDVNVITESSVVPVNTMITTNGFIHLANWDNVANGLANKLHRRFVKTQRYALESGLNLSVNAGVVRIGAGVVWRGVRPFDLQDVYSNLSNNSQWYFAYKVGGVWTAQANAPAFNYTQYQGTNDLQTLLNNNRYTINWVFRGVEDHQHGYYILGHEYLTYADAVAETNIPTLPPLMSTHVTLAGRIICQATNPVPILVETYRPSTFTGAVLTDHNALNNLQGGTASERYHSTQAENTFLAHIAANKVGRDDVNTLDAGHAVIAKAIAGNGMTFSSTGVDAGTGDVTINQLFSGVDAAVSVNQAVANGVAAKAVFGNLRYDINTEWDAINNRFVAKNAGLYNIRCSLTATAAFNNAIHYLMIYKNGVEYLRGPYLQNTNIWTATVGGNVPLLTNDYLEVFIFFAENKTIAAGVGSYLSIARV